MAETNLTEMLTGEGAVLQHRPWPRRVVSREDWSYAAGQLAQGRWSLLALWGEPATVHMALLEESSGTIGVLSHECSQGRFPSVARCCPAAIRLERAIRDLYGLEAEDGPDSRPWLDHGQWGVRAPLGGNTNSPVRDGTEYRFLPVEGESLHRIPVGPVHAGIIEPGHFRFTANGEAVVRLEARLGYVHKGIEGLLEGATLERAARLAGRVSGDSTVAYSLAFARAVEAALEVPVPERAVWLRALLAELERLANHIGDIGAICNDAAFAIMHANCAMLRERILRISHACFGHRLLMDRIVPGGLAADLTSENTDTLRETLAQVLTRFQELVAVYDNSPSMLERAVGTGILKPALARQFGCGGFVGRASLRAFDARRAPGYPPYDALDFEVPLLNSGDVNARVWVRIKEAEQSFAMIDQILAKLPEEAIKAEFSAARPAEAPEGMALVEGFRGDIFVWVRLNSDGTIQRCHLRDPSWFQWPLLEAVIEGNIVADFPLCNKSFNCSYSGHDL